MVPGVHSDATTLELIALLLDKALLITRGRQRIEERSPAAKAYKEMARLFIRVAVFEVDTRVEGNQPEDFQDQWKAVRGCLLLMAKKGKHSTCPAGAGCLLRNDRPEATVVKFAEVRRALIDAYGEEPHVVSLYPEQKNPIKKFKTPDNFAYWWRAVLMTIAILVYIGAYEIIADPKNITQVVPPVTIFILTCVAITSQTTSTACYSLLLAPSPSMGVHAFLLTPCWLILLQETSDVRIRTLSCVVWMLTGVAYAVWSKMNDGLILALMSVVLLFLTMSVGFREEATKRLVKMSEAGIFYKSVMGKYLYGIDFTSSADLITVRSELAQEATAMASIVGKINTLTVAPELSAELDTLSSIVNRIQNSCSTSARDHCDDRSDAESSELITPTAPAAAVSPGSPPPFTLTVDKMKQIYMTAKGGPDQEVPRCSDLATQIRQNDGIRSILLLPPEILEARNLTGIDRSIETMLFRLDEMDTERIPCEQFVTMLPETFTAPAVARRGSGRSRGESVHSNRSLTPSNGSRHRGLTPTGKKSHKFTRTISVTSGYSDRSQRNDTITSFDLHLRDCPNRTDIRCPVTHEMDSHLGVVVLDSDTTDIGTILSWNHYMESTTALKAAEVEGIAFYTLLTNEREQLNVSSVINAVLNKQEEPCDNLTLSFIRKDGDRVMYTVTVVPTYSGRVTDSPNGVVLLCTMKVQDQGSKTKLIEWLVDHIRHPLVTVHASVKRHRKAVLNSRATQQDTITVLDYLSSQTKKLLALAKQLKPLASITLSQHPMAFGATLSGIIADHQTAAKLKNIKLRLDVDSAMPSVIYTDSEKLSDSISYLIFGAIEHSRAGGSVLVTVMREKEDQDTVGTLIIKVKDSGEGVEQEKLKTMFQPGRLWQGDATGTEVDWDLGMCNVKIVIEEMGGLLDVESTLGVGTEFSIYLPLVPVEGAAKEVMSNETTGTTRYTCVVMESNNIKRTAICSHLWQNRCAVMLASSVSALLHNVKSYNVLFYGLHQTNRTSFNDAMEKLANPSSELEIVVMADKALAAHLPRSIQEAVTDGRIHLLQTPIIGSQLNSLLRNIEHKIAKRIALSEELSSIRKALTERSLPWVRGRLLGTGTHGKVYQANKTKSGGVMAVKIITIANDLQVKTILKEITVMSRLQHPNIIHYFYCEKTGKDLHLFMEYAPAGSLAKKIAQSPMEIKLITTFVDQILMGLAFLHENHVIHRDLKPANILIGEGDICKIADFGCALQMEDATTPDFATNGTVLYMAPEVLKGKKHDWRVDIWSLGCIVMELFSGKLPFSHVGGMMKVVGVHLSDADDTDVGSLETVYRGVQEARELAILCLQRIAVRRPSASQLHGHPLLSAGKVVWSDVEGSGSQHLDPARQKSFDSNPNSSGIRGLFIKPNYATGVPPLPREIEPRPSAIELPPRPRLNLGTLYDLDDDDDDVATPKYSDKEGSVVTEGSTEDSKLKEEEGEEEEEEEEIPIRVNPLESVKYVAEEEEEEGN